MQVYNVENTPLVHIFKIDNINIEIFPGIPCNLFVTKSGKCYTSIAFKPVVVVDLYAGDGFSFDVMMNTLKTFVNFNGMICEGVSMENCKPNESLTVHEWPVKHFRSKLCSVFTAEKRVARCLPCRRAQLVQKNRLKRKLEETPTRNLKRARPSSKCAVSRLTPNTRKKRIRAGSYMRKHYSKKVKRFSAFFSKRDMTIDDEQAQQLSNIVRVVQQDYSDVVDTVIKESTESETERQAMREIWQRDCAQKKMQERADFASDQNRNRQSSSGNRWNPITYRMALAVYARSPAAYKALTSFDILQLPSIYSLRNVSGSKKYRSEPGICHEYLEEQQKRYIEFVEEKEKCGDKLPVGEVLIFDEVKVIDKLLWNSKSHRFVGVAMDEQDFAYISDIAKS